MFRYQVVAIAMVLGVMPGLAAGQHTPPAAGGAQPSQYYCLIFGGQGERFQPKTAHTWATFVKTTPQPTGPLAVESFTISWLPVRMPVQPLKLFPEAGRNYGLHETLQLMSTGRQEISMWGPFEIRGDWYGQALHHKQVLDSGAVRFLTLDRSPLIPCMPLRHPEISHCVHAVTRTNKALTQACIPVLWYGELVTRKVVNRIHAVDLLVTPHVTHDWLLPVLAIESYPVKRRAVDEPVLNILR